MPAVDERGKPIPASVKARVKPKKKKPLPKVTVRPSPDATPGPTRKPRVQPRPSPDAQDTARSPAQKTRDRAAVAKSVRESRRKVVSKRGAGSGTRALLSVVRRVREDVYGPGGPNRGPVSTPEEAAKIVARGGKVRPATRAEAADIGAQTRLASPASGASRAAQATIQGIVQKPSTSVPATLKGLRDMAVGIPGAAVKSTVETVEGTKEGDPLRAVKTMASETKKDLEKRYGGIDEPGGVKKMADRVSKEGAAPELVDAAILTTGVAGAAGRGAGAAARTGRLGEGAKRVATVRPELRVSGGKTIKQEPHRNLAVAAGQAAQDVARRKAHRRRAEKAKAKGRTRPAVDVEVKPGEVTPLRVRVRPTPKAERLAVRDVAQRKGRTVIRMKREQAEEVGRGSNRNIARLSKLERTALTYAVKFGIRDPETAVKVLTAHRARVIENRAKSGKEVPAQHRETHENLKDIDKLLAKPAAFTSRVARVADEETARGKRVAEGDPGLSTAQAALRRVAQQAEHLGVERGTRAVEDFDVQASRKALERRDRRALKAVDARTARTERRRVRRSPDVKQTRRNLAAAEGAYEKVSERAEFLERRLKRLELSMERASDRGDSARMEELQGHIETISHDLHGKGGEYERLAELDKQRRTLRGAHEKANEREAERRIGEAVDRTRAADDIDAETRQIRSDLSKMKPNESRAWRGLQERSGVRRVERLPNGKYLLFQRGGMTKAVDLDEAVQEITGKAAMERNRTVRYDTPEEAAAARRAVFDAEDAEKSIRDAFEGKSLPKQLVRKPKEAAESASQYLNRVRAAREEAGLAEPGYFKSSKRPTVRYASYAAGGTKTVQTDKTYTGALHREGREDVRPEAGLSQAFAQNIKRKHNWNLVADNFDAHSFDWSKNKSIDQLLDEVDRRGIDPNSVALWNPGRFRDISRQVEDVDDRGDVTREAGDEVVGAGLDAGVDNAAAKLSDLATKPEDFKSATGFSLVPKAVFDEIHADTRPSGKFARGYEIVKGKQARILLGTSPAWLQFQMASNALLAGLAGTGPRDMVKARQWWKGLTKEERDAIEPYIGAGSFRDTHQQTKMGAATNNGIVNAWRAMKQTPFFHKPRRVLKGGSAADLNPLDILFRADAAQNNFFRKSVLYSQVKRDAYQRIGRDVGQMKRIQEQVMDTLTLGPKEQMKAVIRDKDALERHAKHVSDFLGDYQTFTAKERRILQRNVMFYGYLRFSLRFTLWTMPTKHPIVSGILAQLGRMQTEEVRELLGGDALPYQLGKFYVAKDGKLKSINVARANPTSNALFDALSELPDPKKAIGFAPPVVQSLINQLASENVVLGRDFRVRGKEDMSEWEGKPGMEAVDRGRIFANDMAGLLAPYRSWEKAVTKGVPLGDDTLMGSIRPTKFEDRDVQLGIQRQAAQEKRTVGRRLREDLVTPWLPTPDRAREQSALASARKELRAITKEIEETPQSKRTTPETSWKGGGFYTKDFQAKLDKQKAQRALVNRLQAAGPPAPPAPRLQRRPLSPREAAEQKRDQIRTGDPREEALKKIGRIRARQEVRRGG